MSVRRQKLWIALLQEDFRIDSLANEIFIHGAWREETRPRKVPESGMEPRVLTRRVQGYFMSQMLRKVTSASRRETDYIWYRLNYHKLQARDTAPAGRDSDDMRALGSVGGGDSENKKKHKKHKKHKKQKGHRRAQECED